MEHITRVMVVDDYAAIRKIVRSMFESLGYEVVDAENGAEAVRTAPGLHPDLIVLDLSMPIMNGLEAAKKLTSLLPAVPLIMFTNHSGRVIEQEAHAAGFSAIVSKTDSADLLIAQVTELLGKRKCA